MVDWDNVIVQLTNTRIENQLLREQRDAIKQVCDTLKARNAVLRREKAELAEALEKAEAALRAAHEAYRQARAEIDRLYGELAGKTAQSR